MTHKQQQQLTVALTAIVSGGQAIGTLSDGKKAFTWNGLPGEEAVVQVTKRKSNFVEGWVTDILKPSPDRITPADPDTYLSTSPWQMMTFAAEQRYKAQLIQDAFALHKVKLPSKVTIFTDNHELHYRNKVEFSWYSDASPSGDTLDLAFFKRGSKGKVIVNQCSLLPEQMLDLSFQIRDYLHSAKVSARQLKTLLIRSNQQGDCVWQLYVKDKDFSAINEQSAQSFGAQGGEVIYSDPKSPASRITERLLSVGETTLTDTILGIPFRYATEGFFQVNIPVYEQALKDMQTWIPADKPAVDLYSGVGTIGLTIGDKDVELIEINQDAVREMNRNITALNSNAKAILAPSEKALQYITSTKTIIIDPPRAGMHQHVVDRLLTVRPQRIVYLSCNPVTQARDVALLAPAYQISAHKGYNFFPRTPHIENLVVLDRQ